MDGLDTATSDSPVADYPSVSSRGFQSVAEMFVDRARLSPERIALVDGDTSFTYRELHVMVDRIAGYLLARGVGPETIVGCYAQRSVTSVVAPLAVLRAGGAYLLLDAHVPVERLRFMVSDARPALILSDTNSLERLGDCPQVALADVPTAQPQPPIDPPGRIARESLAYLAYTSGTTGRPKGVLITHGNIAEHSRTFSSYFAMGPEDRIPLMATLTFDVAAEEMFPSLISGCRLVVSGDQGDMREFHREVCHRGYTVLNLPAPLWHRWVSYLARTGDRVPPALRLVIVGSDKILSSHLTVWRALAGADRVRWVAAYGTTETTITSTCYLGAASDDLRGEATVPIGTAMPGVELHILDDRGDPVRPGEIGELYIGGAGIARGYHRLPARTAESFVDLPQGIRGTTRAYKTGDLVRQRPDGAVVWTGRRDLQVKVNGFRVEPAEVECVLREIPSIADVVVAPEHSDTPTGETRLTAFIELAADSTFDERSARAYLSARLHASMIPARFIAVSALPIGATGKVDRPALIALSAANAVSCI